MVRAVRGEPVYNRILLALPPAVFEALVQHLEHVELPRGRVLSVSDQRVDHFYFINRGMVSITKTMRDGRSVEVGATGIEGVTSSEALFDDDQAALDREVQVSGSAFVIGRRTLGLAMGEHPALRRLLQGFLRVQIERLAQTAACNKLHTLGQRSANWLLLARDSAGSGTFSVTQEFLAMALGVQRPSLSTSVSTLKQNGLIQYQRGKVTIVDRDGLENTACECYAATRATLDRLLGHN